MSMGIEVFGVLSTFNSVFSIIKVILEGSSPYLRSPTTYSTKYFQNDLAAQHFVFENVVHKLFTSARVSQQGIAGFLAEPESFLAQNPEIEAQIRSYLGDNFRPFTESIKHIQRVTRKVKKSLPIEPDTHKDTLTFDGIEQSPGKMLASLRSSPAIRQLIWTLLFRDRTKMRLDYLRGHHNDLCAMLRNLSLSAEHLSSMQDAHQWGTTSLGKPIPDFDAASCFTTNTEVLGIALDVLDNTDSF